MSLKYKVVYLPAKQHDKNLKGWHAIIEVDAGKLKDGPGGYGLTKAAARKDLEVQAWLFLKGMSQHLYRCLAAARKAKS